jgi:hypothetical protein
MIYAIVIIMVKKIPIGISLPKNIVEKIDNERQDVPRSKYLLRILERSKWLSNNKLNSLDTGLERLESSEH